MTAVFPSGSNTFVPDLDASGRLIIGFSRNVKDFPLNRYVQIIPSKKTEGLYLNLTPEEAARLINSDGANFNWPDSADAPTGVDGTESFEFLNYKCQRKAYPVELGDLAVDQADWDISQAHINIKAQQAMTDRTLSVVTALTTTGNYAASHTSAAASISGNSGTWAASTTARQDIKRSLNYAAELIMLDTLSVVKPEQLMLVLNPTAARTISQCQEIVDHIKGSPDALAQIRGEGRNALFGLPDRLYGYEVVIENTARVTTRKGATTSRSFVWPSATAVMCARVGALEGIAGGPNFSTCNLFVYSKDDMAVEVKKDVDNRKTKIRVVDNRVAKVVAPASGFVFTSIL